MVACKFSEKNIFILGITSDIGVSLAKSYLEDGHRVFGTYRNKEAGEKLVAETGMALFHCDIAEPKSIEKSMQHYTRLSVPWDIFISAVGTTEPLGKFFSCDFDTWDQSVRTNCNDQLRVLHFLYPFRRKGSVSHVAFFAGGGTNNAFPNFSAYCASKIMLIKMCELLDDENEDLNVFIVGPGWVRTKIHNQVLNHPEGAGKSYQKVKKFLDSGESGTSNESIYDCINWCIEQGKEVAGGRNFSVVHDPWIEEGQGLVTRLRENPDKFKLRRNGNVEP